MIPIKFPESNVTFAEHQPQYLPLPARVTNDGKRVTSCWTLTWGERLRVLAGGRVWLTQLTFGQPLQAVKLAATRPF